MMPAHIRPTEGPLRAEDGAITVFGLFIFVAVLMIAGLALDVSNAYRIRTQLQVAGDAAGHAALVAREFNSPSVAIATALEIAHANMPSGDHNSSLRAEDIVFGHWDGDTGSFEADPNAFDAVLVNTGRSQDRTNSVSTYLLRFAGITALDVRRQTVFETYRPTCLKEGLVGEEEVFVNSGNVFVNGFCVHSNDRVGMSNNNEFEPGTIVSMPDIRSLDIPDNGLESNDGLAAALRDGSYRLRILQRVRDIIDGVQNPNSVYYPDYIHSSIPIHLNRNDKLDEDAFEEHRIHRIECMASNQKTQIHADTVLKNVVIWTNCEFMFGQGVVLENVVIVNESTSAKSFNAASGVQIGKDDDCAAGGGAQIVTLGGIQIPAQLMMYGGQMIAVGDVSFEAEAEGIEGASIVSGGEIIGSSGGRLGFCAGNGMEDNFEAEYFRLAY
ncbi:MAG: Tad domain-containing protein [Maritimibacter sp.]|nr:Tad domain-containing protein [Maritimibacter sp.]